MARLTKLSKSIVRRIDDSRLVVRITVEGIEFRGYGRRKWRRLTWEQIASLTSESGAEVLRTAERNGGLRVLKQIGAA